MFPGGQRNELRLEVTLPKSILVGELWHHLLDIIFRITLALILGREVFFGGTCQSINRKFYDAITDLDSHSDVRIEK